MHLLWPQVPPALRSEVRVTGTLACSCRLTRTSNPQPIRVHGTRSQLLFQDPLLLWRSIPCLCVTPSLWLKCRRVLVEAQGGAGAQHSGPDERQVDRCSTHHGAWLPVPPGVHPGRPQQILGCLPPTEDAWLVFWVPSLGLAQPQPLWASEQ